MGKKIVAIIPARYGSTRFPGKPLAPIMGKPMVEWVYNRTRQCELLSRVLVATDDERIFRAVRNFGGDVVMTSSQHFTGTDRLAEAVRDIEVDIVLNVQGDEPLVRPDMLTGLIKPLVEENDIAMSTLSTTIRPGDLEDPDCVKVVTDLEGNALYFSRAPIPYPWERSGGRSLLHLGFYGFRRDFLLQFPRLPRTPLEGRESLEQLRVLEHGYKIRVVYSQHRTFGVDRPADISLVTDHLREEEEA